MEIKTSVGVQNHTLKIPCERHLVPFQRFDTQVTVTFPNALLEFSDSNTITVSSL